MDKPERDQPGGPELTPAAALLASIEAHREHHIVKMTPLRAVLPLVAAWVRATETRLAALEPKHVCGSKDPAHRCCGYEPQGCCGS
jgi:hypothetical protein